MPDTVLNALKNKLARYEADGELDKVKRVKARIELEKAPKGEAPKLAMTLSPPTTAPAVLGATVSTTTVFNTNPPQSTVKKVAPKKAAKKRNK